MFGEDMVDAEPSHLFKSWHSRLHGEAPQGEYSVLDICSSWISPALKELISSYKVALPSVRS